MPSVSEISGCIRQERRKGGNVFHFYGGASRRRRRKAGIWMVSARPQTAKTGERRERYFFSFLFTGGKKEMKENGISFLPVPVSLSWPGFFHDGTAISFRYFHGVAAIVAGHGGQGPSYVAHVENRQFPGGRLFPDRVRRQSRKRDVPPRPLFLFWIHGCGP